jgi:hypothetical protein
MKRRSIRVKKLFRKILSGAVVLSLAAPLTAYSADQDVLQKIDALTKELDALKQQVKESNSKIKENETKTEDTQRKVAQVERKSLGRWLTIGGDYRFRYDYLHGSVPGYTQFLGIDPATGMPVTAQVSGFGVKNNSLYTNRFGLNLHAKATQDVTVTARLLMYKVAGEQNDAAVIGSAGLSPSNVGPFFADRAGLFDGTVGHVPGDSRLAVDRAYVDWKNILGQPLWFSIGRRPSTGGSPSHLRENNERPGVGGTPALLVDYAFDGATIGYAPDIDALPGAYVKACYGRGFEDGITTDAGNGLRNTDMVGVQVVPYDTDFFRALLQYNRGINIFNAPVFITGPNITQNNGAFSAPSVNLGDIDWYGVDMLGKVKHVGVGNLNWFVDGAVSNTHPNNNTLSLGPYMPAIGLLYTGNKESKTGWAVYVGGRYDIEKTGTKLGFEFNHGSKDWITFAPAADDMWTAKVGTRGNVYEGYIIQELKLKPISSYFSKAFFRVGYQYYDFDYTGSNNWVGGPVGMGDLGNPMNAQMLTPIKNAQDLYATFEVHF